MTAQFAELARYQQRLEAIDSSGWPVAQQADHILVKAEMNGLDFDHRIRRPWASMPAFYATVFAAQSDTPAREGPGADGWMINLWTYDYPLADGDAERLATQLQTVPPLLQQAQSNLVEDARDLWVGGIRDMRLQASILEALAERVSGTSAGLDAAIREAHDATVQFTAWLEGELPSKSGPSGVGKENLNWYLQNVHLVNYTWDDEVALMRHELARSHATLRLIEHRNRDLPPLPVVASAEEYDRRFNASVDEFVAFLDDEEIISVRDYMAPALRAKIGSFSPAPAVGPRGFFSEVSYRDPVAMRTHSFHWTEIARIENEPHSNPIRRGPALSNIWGQRSEGLATGMEEWMMHAGLFADRPRGKEIIQIMLAQRAARALGGLMMHGEGYTIEEASEFAAKWTPRGWMPADSDTVLTEQHIYLQQPGYGTSYLIGKIEIEKLMAERALELGDGFTVKGFMDELSTAGVIPVSLVWWELTGDDSQIPRLVPLERFLNE
jgi:hypothetical protein|tara:strand:- start:75 stop:1562 length:1488 start_codon:yes stop_codon:yes gene_type:complete